MYMHRNKLEINGAVVNTVLGKHTKSNIDINLLLQSIIQNYNRNHRIQKNLTRPSWLPTFSPRAVYNLGKISEYSIQIYIYNKSTLAVNTLTNSLSSAISVSFLVILALLAFNCVTVLRRVVCRSTHTFE